MPINMPVIATTGTLRTPTKKKFGAIVPRAGLLRNTQDKVRPEKIAQSPRAEMAQPHATTNTAAASPRVQGFELGCELRKHFNLHLLRSDVVGDILGGDRQLVRAWNCFARDQERACVGGGSGIPSE